MNAFHRLHQLRMENDAAGFEMEDMRERFDRIANRHSNGTAPRAIVAYQLFQTPASVALRMAQLLDLSPGARVLEPSAGLGRLLDALEESKPFETVAVESNPDCAGELFRQDRSRVRILQRDFLELTPEEIGTFDAVLMNPPFHMRADIRHILHALTFLRPDGKLVALMLDTPHRERALQSMAAHWERLPEGTFAKEGTRVATVIASFTK